MELIRIENLKEIYTSMAQLSSDMYNQSLNDTYIIKNLSKKYSQYSNFYICKEKEEIVGYCAFYTNKIHNDACFLSMLVVKNEYRNKGIGTLFINKIEEICKIKNIDTIELSVNKNNEKAIGFYTKEGFEIIKSDEIQYTMKKSVLKK